MNRVLTGLERLKTENFKGLKEGRLGLVASQSSVDSSFMHAGRVVSEKFPGRLRALFGPQHGYRLEDQDNMIETGHARDSGLDVPVFSLYSESRIPSSGMLDLIDILLIDMQDVGTRVYTFASTMLNCMKAAKEAGKRVVILDRPNPLGGEKLEGNILVPELYSFVGPFRLPMRHGLTMGELALVFNRELEIDCELDVITMKGWRRDMLWPETSLPWVMPSPNMPVFETSLVYPGQVIWEGTNISEGRGTCRPFEIMGSPFLRTGELMDNIPSKALRGCHLREISFKPTFNKWSGELCQGYMIHITDKQLFRPLMTSIALLRAVIETHGKAFKWKEPPYEYVVDKLPIDVILGSSSLRKEVEKGTNLLEIDNDYLSNYEEFAELRRPYLLY